jgi:hypothetical protein
MAANHDLTRRAIEVMTAWLDDPNKTDFAVSRAVDLIVKQDEMQDAAAAAHELITGFINLSGLLLFRIEEATGDKGPTTLQKMAAKTVLGG